MSFEMPKARVALVSSLFEAGSVAEGRTSCSARAMMAVERDLHTSCFCEPAVSVGSESLFNKCGQSGDH